MIEHSFQIGRFLAVLLPESFGGTLAPSAPTKVELSRSEPLTNHTLAVSGSPCGTLEIAGLLM